MELIIILVLISIASSVFQAMNQDKGKAAAKGVKPLTIGPASQNINPQVMKPVKPGSQLKPQKGPIVKLVEAAPQEAPAKNAFDGMSSAEGVQTEGQLKAVTKIQPEINSVEENPIVGNIGLDDLQRSIVMAEILGKPRALKGFTR